MTPTRRILVHRTLAFFGLLLLGVLAISAGRPYIHKAWHSLRLVNVVVNLTPTFLAILFAFVVDRDLAGKMRWRMLFRTFVIGCGVSLSGLLWHQQVLTDKQNEDQINQAVTSAVTKANQHSDAKFAAVNTKVDSVDGKVVAVGSSLASTTTTLSTDIQRTGDAIRETSDRLDASIGKVGKPDPPELGKLRFSFWKEGMSESDEPVEVLFLSKREDNTYTFEFDVRDVASVSADEVDVWVNSCDQCTFAKEPEGFEQITGTFERHKHIGLLNPGVGNKMSVDVRVGNPLIRTFTVQLRASCKNCGKIMEPKVLVINLM